MVTHIIRSLVVLCPTPILLAIKTAMPYQNRDLHLQLGKNPHPQLDWFIWGLVFWKPYCGRISWAALNRSLKDLFSARRVEIRDWRFRICAFKCTFEDDEEIFHWLGRGWLWFPYWHRHLAFCCSVILSWSCVGWDRRWMLLLACWWSNLLKEFKDNFFLGGDMYILSRSAND